jgi:arginase
VIEDILWHFGNTAPIHVSFDVDALDPDIAPSTGTPVPSGLLEREAKYVCERLAESGKLVSMDVVEVNPRVGEPHNVARTTRAARSIAYSCLGESYLR